MATETTRAPSRALAIPAWAWVAGVVVVSAAVWYGLGRRIVAPWILTDELVYSEAAKSFAATGEILMRDEHWQQPGLLYPVLISPAWALWTAIPEAYAAAKVINAVLISLAAVPAYLLARRVLSQPLALVAPLLTVAVPSMLYAGTLMTENAFYPLFLGVALALVLVLERPTLLRSAVLVVLVVLAFLTRAQAVALLPAVLTAPILLVLLRRRALRELKAYWPLYGLTALVIVPAVVVQLARGKPISGLFGRYSTVSDAEYPFWSVVKWFVYHVAELDLYVAVVPFAALILLVLVFRRLSEREQVFTAATLALSFWLLLVVAAVDQSYTFVHRVAERNMFYVAPLLFVALLIWIDRGLPRPRWRAAAVAVAAAALPAVLPLQWMLNVSIVSDTLALIPWWQLDLELASSAWPRALLVVACTGAAALFLFLPRRLWLAFPAFVLACLVTVTAFAERQWQHQSENARAAVGREDVDWIDRAVAPANNVAVLDGGHAARVQIWETEFFNRTVGAVYGLGEPIPGDLPETPLQVEPDGRTPATARYALADATVVPAGRRVGSAGELTLYRVYGGVRLRTWVRGLYPGQTWSGRRVTYTRYGCRGGRLRVGLASDPRFFLTPKTVSIRGGVTRTVRVPPRSPVDVTLPLVPRGGVCRLDFTVTPAPVLSMAPGATPQPFGLSFTFK